MKKRQSRGRKLLIATAGLATLSYVACKKQDPQIETMPVGNLPAPMPDVQPDPGTATPVTSGSAAVKPPDPEEIPVGNLPSPMPHDGPPPPTKQPKKQ